MSIKSVISRTYKGVLHDFPEFGRQQCVLHDMRILAIENPASFYADTCVPVQTEQMNRQSFPHGGVPREVRPSRVLGRVACQE